MSRLALGTAQFGSHYGITNRAGQVDADEAGRILSLAREAGIDCIDTARLYGDSEAVIGRHQEIARDFRIVTKTPTFSSDAGDARAEVVRAFAASLQGVRHDSLYGLLIHDARDLLGQRGDQLWSGLEELKASGQVQKIGVSVYGAEAIANVLSRYPIDIIQLPFNALDRRLTEGGQLEALSQAGIEVHARSVFLQGLLLTPADDLPTEFVGLRPGIEQLDELFARKGLSRLEGLLAIALAPKEIARVVVGVTSAAELRAITLAADRAQAAEAIDEADLPRVDPRFLDPSRWSELGRD